MRVVDADCVDEFEAFLKTAAARAFQSNKKLVESRRLTPGEVPAGIPSQSGARDGGAVYQHNRIPFASYPHEWPPEMLWAAGQLTLELGKAVLADGFGLKDATPQNVLFDGPEPVFIDALSFEKRNPGDPQWKACSQFIRSFLLPLMANQRWGIPVADIFTTHRDGLEPEEVYRFCGFWAKWNPRVLALVAIPTWLSRRSDPGDEKIYEQKILADPEKAQFILESVFNRMNRALHALRPRARQDSAWANYMGTHSYDDPAFAAKEKFVADTLAEFKPARVLDAGANTGHFSALAAQTGAAVVAIDIDPVCAGAIWRRARDQKLNILPLVINLARPAPALGWRNRECPSFLERAAGSFEGVFMLALLHHLLVTERIPLDEVLKLAADLATEFVVMEFVAPADAMFRRLTRGRGHLHAGLTTQAFETAAVKYFEIARSLALPGTERTLYCLRKRSMA